MPNSRQNLPKTSESISPLTVTACAHHGAGDPNHVKEDGLSTHGFQADGPIIDVHAHIYPERYLDFLERSGIDPASTAIARDMNASDEERFRLGSGRWMRQTSPTRWFHSLRSLR